MSFTACPVIIVPAILVNLSPKAYKPISLQTLNPQTVLGIWGFGFESGLRQRAGGELREGLVSGLCPSSGLSYSTALSLTGPNARTQSVLRIVLTYGRMSNKMYFLHVRVSYDEGST